jgi:hypothetical protein
MYTGYTKDMFVFGSNKAGRHGKGAALTARLKHGAIYGKGFAAQGDSYAIPTKGYRLEPLPLEEIKGYVEGFLRFAHTYPNIRFTVTNIGCGLAGYKPAQIAPFFRGAPNNCYFSKEFEQYIR